jgi:hypothetical protein
MLALVAANMQRLATDNQVKEKTMQATGNETAKKPKKKTIEIRHNGEGKEFAYKPHEKVHKLLEEAIAAFGVTDAIHTLALYTSEGVELKDEQQTLAEAGVEAGDVLRLRTSKVKGGAALAVREGLLAQTLSVLRRCGAGREECVAFWAGPVGEPGVADTLLHPDHRSGRGGYEVSEEWLADAWERLDEEGLAIRVQVHTHPFEAFHSATDDAYPIVGTPGFYSLVLPRFGEEPQTLADAYLARLEADGTFAQVDVFELLGNEVAA